MLFFGYNGSKMNQRKHPRGKGKNKRHWLDKAKPKYWASRGYWRVRAMRQGEASQWLMQQGKGDPSATGKAMAYAEWHRILAEIQRAEMPPEMFTDLTDEQMAQRATYYHWQSIPTMVEKMPYDEWQEYQTWRALKASAKDAASGIPLAIGNGATPAITKTFADLTAIYRAHLDHRLAATVKGMRSKQDISEARHHQYTNAIAHLDAAVGSTIVISNGEWQIDEKQLSAIIERYRGHCIDQMKSDGWSGHWFNERAKTVRSLVTYLVANRLADRTPPNIEALTEKFSLAVNPKPIPLGILQAIWIAADEQFRAYMLLALNCGFRQTEIGGLMGSDIKTVGGQCCISKPRGKTGIPIAIPLWQRTQAAIDATGAQGKASPLFERHDAKAFISKLSNRLKKIKQHVSKRHPAMADEMAEYSFEHFRDTGASYIDGINPILTPLYLGHSDKRQAKSYVGIIDGQGGQLDGVLAQFEQWLALA